MVFESKCMHENNLFFKLLLNNQSFDSLINFRTKRNIFLCYHPNLFMRVLPFIFNCTLLIYYVQNSKSEIKHCILNLYFVQLLHSCRKGTIVINIIFLLVDPNRVCTLYIHL